MSGGAFKLRGRPRVRRVFVIERDGPEAPPALFWSVIGVRPDLDLVLARMKQDGIDGVPIPARLQVEYNRITYWHRVYAALVEGTTFRIYKRQRAGVFAPPWLIGHIQTAAIAAIEVQDGRRPV